MSRTQDEIVRIYNIPCPHCPSVFRGANPWRVYDRHVADHRAQSVQAVASS